MVRHYLVGGTGRQGAPRWRRKDAATLWGSGGWALAGPVAGETVGQKGKPVTYVQRLAEKGSSQLPGT